MNIRDIMTRDLSVAEADDTLDDIAAMMRQQDIGAVPVMDEDELIGIITDRDIVLRCVADGRDPRETAADEIISSDMEWVEPDDDVETARRIMSERQIRRLPVMEHGELVGMVSLGDLAIKTGNEQRIANTLEGISEGVRATNQQPAIRSTRPQRSSQQASRDRIPEGQQGRVERIERVNESVQGISNQSAKSEVKRQERVVPIRPERQEQSARGKQEPSARAEHKHKKNPKNVKRKAG